MMFVLETGGQSLVADFPIPVTVGAAPAANGVI